MTEYTNNRDDRRLTETQSVLYENKTQISISFLIRNEIRLSIGRHSLVPFFKVLNLILRLVNNTF